MYVYTETTGHLSIHPHIYVLIWEVVIWVYIHINTQKVLNYDLCIFQYVRYTPINKTQ